MGPDVAGFLCVAHFIRHPLSVSVLRTDPPLPHFAGARIGALHRCHARRSVWLFQRTLLAAGEEVGKRGTGPSLSSLVTWRGLPCPAGVLALPEGTQRTARPRSGPGPQGSSPSTPPPRAEPAPSPSTRIRFMTRVPARERAGLCGRFWGRGENGPIIVRSSDINGLAEKYSHAEHCVWSAMGWRRHARRDVFVE